MGSFRPLEGAKPFTVSIGEESSSEEDKIEVIFPKYKEECIVSAMKTIHPYEEVSYQIYVLDNAHKNIGSGIVGQLAKSMDVDVFLKKLKINMQTDCVRHTKIVKNKIKRVAVCGGSGSFLLSHAKRVKADIFITADFKYHEFFD